MKSTKMHLLTVAILAGTITGASQCRTTQAAESKRPNFLIVLSDDLGYGDLACFGHSLIKTPNLDRLAAEGLKLTNCYAAAANCSPARTGMMTGRTPYRVGIHNWIPHLSPMHVRDSEITVATLLRKSGYATCQSGKWHMNGRFNLSGQPQPGDHGFDHWFSTQNNALPNHRNPNNFVRNGQPVGQLEGYSAKLVADEAIDWLTNIRPKKKPFFLYVCFHEPHEPIASNERFTRMYPSPDPSLSAHHGNITQMDHAFGRLMQTVDKLDLRAGTLVFFTSDNGPARTRWHPHGSSGPLRDKKGSMYEGGIRVPGIVRWPGHTEPGTVCDEPVCGVDVLPTLCQIAKVAVPTDRTIDGTSILPIFEGRPIERKTPLYWQFNFSRSAPKVAMRVGDWKILAQLTTKPFKPTADILPEHGKALKEAELTAFELYNLRDDIGETTDLAAKEPDRLKRMSAQLTKLYHEVRDESPVWPAWESPHHEGKLIEWPPYKPWKKKPAKKRP